MPFLHFRAGTKSSVSLRRQKIDGNMPPPVSDRLTPVEVVDLLPGRRLPSARRHIDSEAGSQTNLATDVYIAC